MSLGSGRESGNAGAWVGLSCGHAPAQPAPRRPGHPTLQPPLRAAHGPAASLPAPVGTDAPGWPEPAPGTQMGGHSRGESGRRSGDLWVPVPRCPSRLCSARERRFPSGEGHTSGGDQHGTPEPLSGAFLTVSSPEEKFPGTTLRPPTRVPVAFFSVGSAKLARQRGQRGWGVGGLDQGLRNSVLGGN